MKIHENSTGEKRGEKTGEISPSTLNIIFVLCFLYKILEFCVFSTMLEKMLENVLDLTC